MSGKPTSITAAGHGDALPTFLEVLEQVAEDRRHRRITRLRRESRLPAGKTWETPAFAGGRLFEHDRMPLGMRQQLDHLAQGAEGSEVLFTLIAERYERRSLGITSNLVFSDRVYSDSGCLATPRLQRGPTVYLDQPG